MGAVLNGICEKLIRRHPHIYGDTLAEDEATVKANWEKIKLKEKGKTSVCCLLYTSPSPRDVEESRMPSSA